MQMPRKARCAATIAAALLVTACGGGNSGANGSASVVPVSPVAVVSGLPVAVRSETFVDTHRPTAANGSYPEIPSRTLVTTIFIPTGAPGPFPLIVFSHGFTASPGGYELLLRAWAGAGYVVAAPAFPLTNGNAAGGPTQNDVVNQPGDVTFVITSVIQLSDDPTSALHGLVDRHRVGVAGHSAGAATTLGVALDTCCRDYRIGAAAILAGGLITFPFGSYPAPEHTPVLFLHGTNDDSIQYSSGLLAYHAAHPPRFFITLPGSGHSPPFGGDPARADARVVMKTTIDFFDRYLKGSVPALLRLRQDANLPGTASLQDAQS